MRFGHYFPICATEMLQKRVKVFSEVISYTLSQHIVKPIRVVFVHQSISEDPQHFMHPQSIIVKKRQKSVSGKIRQCFDVNLRKVFRFSTASLWMRQQP